MQPSTKRNLKKVWSEIKKIWAEVLRFLSPYKNLDRLMLKPKVEPFLQKHINQVYLAGLVIMAVFAVLGLISFRIVTIFGTLAILIIIFLIFRLACELIIGKEKKAAQKVVEEKTETAEKVETVETTKPVKKTQKHKKKKVSKK